MGGVARADQRDEKGAAGKPLQEHARLEGVAYVFDKRSAKASTDSETPTNYVGEQSTRPRGGQGHAGGESGSYSTSHAAYLPGGGGRHGR